MENAVSYRPTSRKIKIGGPIMWNTHAAARMPVFAPTCGKRGAAGVSQEHGTRIQY